MRYPIKFTTDYGQHGVYLDEYHANQQRICNKYRGTEISIEELPDLVKEAGERVIFDGETIEIYNDYRE